MNQTQVKERALDKQWCLQNGDLLTSKSITNPTGFHYVGYVPDGIDDYGVNISTSAFHENLGNFSTDLLDGALPKRDGSYVIYHEWVNKV